MNAGAMGGWIFDVVESVELMDQFGRVAVHPRAALQVDYRHCAELEQAIALGAIVRAPAEKSAAEIRGVTEGFRSQRQASQPREPSAGCIFKNPPDDSAGRLIDRAGLKGTRVGGAEVSDVHANFIINRGGATAADVIALVRMIRAEVRARHGVELEPEVLLAGSRWADVL